MVTIIFTWNLTRGHRAAVYPLYLHGDAMQCGDKDADASVSTAAAAAAAAAAVLGSEQRNS